MKRKQMKKILIVSALLVGILLTVSCQKKDQPEKIEQKTTPDTGAEMQTETPAENQGSKEDTPMKAVDSESFAKELQAKLAKHWPHMKNIWPSMDYTEHPLILFHLNEDMSTKQAWLLTTGEIKKLEESALKNIEVPTPGGYNQAEFQGKPAIVLALDDVEFSRPDAINQTYRLATHELVHFYHQALVEQEEGDSRAQEYPLEATPRVYRRMIYLHLIAAYENPKDAEDHLAKAKYWQDKWATEFPKEYKAIKSTDMVEGTAKYIENLGDFAADVQDQKIKREKALENIQKKQLFESADSESYEIGFVAALLLDERQPDWKENFYQEGKTLVEKLLEKQTPAKEELDPVVEKEASKYIEELNEDAKESLKDILAAYEDKKIPYLKIAVPQTSASYSIQDHFRYKDTDIMTNYANKFTLEGKDVEIKVINVMQEMQGEQIYLTIPLNMEYKFAQGKLTINTDKLKVDGVSVEMKEIDGRQVYITK